MRRSGLLALLALSILGMPGALLQAASTLNFPRLSHDNSTLTGMAIVNPSAADAAVTLTAYGEDGSPLTGITNPVEILVPANQQLARLTTELFGNNLDPSTIGWFQAASARDDLVGFFLFLDVDGTRFDGADLPESAASLVFNQVRVDAGRSTELNLINPGDVPAALELDLVDGETTVSKSLSLLPKGVARLDAASFFGISSAQPTAYLRVNSDTPVAGFEFIKATSGDLLGLNARPAAERLSTLFFPQLAVLGPWKTELGLVNYSSGAAIATISAFQPDGTLYGTKDLETNPIVRSLDPGASLLLDVETAFGFSGSATLDGWIQVESTSEALNGFVSYGVTDAGSIASVTASAEGQRRGIFSHIATVDGFFTGVAILNSGQLATGVRVLAIQPSGKVLGSFNTVLRPRERISKLINELVPDAAAQRDGLIWVKSDLPVHLTSLFGSSTVLANIPPQAATGLYNPDQGIPSLEVAPPLAILPPGALQTFTASGVTGDIDWKVNDISSGDAAVGTISAEGTYTAPAAVPDPAVLTVTAEVAGQSAGASVDVLEKQAVFGAQTLVQSVAYLDTLQTLYTAELTLLSGSGATARPAGQKIPQQEAGDSDLVEWLPDGSRTTRGQFSGETISKLLAYTASTGRQFLLLAARTSGRILRFDPESGATVEIGANLNQPSAMVFDESSETLLVAEQDRVSSIPRLQIELGLASRLPGPSQPRRLELFPVTRADGIALDRCTGNIFISNRETGEILEYVARTNETRILVDDFTRPTQLLASYRNGVSCPDSLHLLAIDQGRDRIFLITPADRRSRPWAEARQSTDFTFLAGDNPLSQSTAVLLAEEAEAEAGRFEINAVPVRNLYRSKPANRPREQEPEESQVPGKEITSVDFTVTFNRAFTISCTLGSESGQESANLQFKGELGERSGQPVVTGSFSGSFQESFQSSLGGESESCSLQGEFEAELALSQPQEPGADLSGTWQVNVQGTERCTDDFGPQEELFAFLFSVEIVQSGSEFSGSFLAPLDEDEEVDITCSQPGVCSFEDPELGSCSVTCTPATDRCQVLFQVSGTVTSG